MVTASSHSIHNSTAIDRADVPHLNVAEFRSAIVRGVEAGGRLSALFGLPAGDGRVQLHGILTHPDQGSLSAYSTAVDRSYPALTPDCPSAHWFERELAEQWGVVPEGHPWLKPLRFHSSYRPGRDAWSRATGDAILPSVIDQFRVEGQEIHEVAVGPIHAGVIEPGHFRFQCHGEIVFHLEISLGFQHRGIERALIGGPNKRTPHYMETLSGDTSVGHMTAYCQALEGLAGCNVPIRAQALRGVALELERLANHTGDLGGLAQDIGFLPTSAFCGRLRGDFLNSTALICGNRFGRSLVRPGGVGFNVDTPRIDDLKKRLEAALRDVAGAANLLWDSPSVEARFEDVGTVSYEACLALGMVGPAARACGVERDLRHDLPSGIYRYTQIPVSSCHTGDVFARAYVRWLEIQRSVAFIRELLETLPGGSIRVPLAALRPNAMVVSLVEGWRGEICHVALTDDEGKFAAYKVCDPSFHNWIGLAMAVRNQQISDFPLCNKSFSLSYCGHDL